MVTSLKIEAVERGGGACRELAHDGVGVHVQDVGLVDHAILEDGLQVQAEHEGQDVQPR